MSQREMKFRGWHKEQKKMYSAEELGADQLTIMPDGRGFVNVNSVSTKLSQIDDGKKMIPLQFIGLKSKNGKEIYEGDICETSTGYRFVVKMQLFGLGVPGSECYGYHNYEDVRIIGNIHQNPELLNK